MIWDNEETAWMGPIIDFTHPEMVDSFKLAVGSIGLPSFVPYQLRHSGPSWDRQHKRRSQLAIMKRGRWKSLASLVRYEKGGMVTKDYGKLHPRLREHLELCSRVLEQVMLGGRLPPRM